ncbi:MAG: DUF1638 domain-containing protein [Pseudomonadota bacterium]
MSAPGFEALTETGWERAGPTSGAVTLIACGALAREVLALQQANGWEWMRLTCLPAKLHNAPERIPDAVRRRIREVRDEGARAVFVLYADCGTGGLLDRVCEEEGATRIPGPHCYSFFAGNEAFAETAEEEDLTAFFLTDFLARQFDTLIWRGLGLNRHPDMRDMLFGHYTKLVYLVQAEDPVLDARAEEAAHRLGLAYERRVTGYGDLAPFLAHAAAAR